MTKPRIGVWLIGARGGVAPTALVGMAALRRGLAAPVGLVSALPQFAPLGLVDWSELVVGGHEIRQTPLFEEAMKLCRESRALDEHLVTACREDLDAVDAEIRPGIVLNVGDTIERLADPAFVKQCKTPREAMAAIASDIDAFAERHKLERVVVVNVASTEPANPTEHLPDQWADLEPLLDGSHACPLPASSLYAAAALDAGYAYINFTPSLGSAPAALCDLAALRGVCHIGHDGKTGETLLKSVLAPMFAQRNLQVMSWVGHNIFGNMDAVVLNDPANKQTKVTSKDRLLHQILGYSPQTLVSIEYIESMGDWKTAWDHIHFRGFLGTPMTMQFTWQGCDSLLAAPLVLDLIRLTERAARAGQTGLLTALAAFFKSPLGTSENDFFKQMGMLERWIEETATE